MSIYRHEVSLARVILGVCLVGGRAYGGVVVGKKLPSKIGYIIAFIIVIITIILTIILSISITHKSLRSLFG